MSSRNLKEMADNLLHSKLYKLAKAKLIREGKGKKITLVDNISFVDIDPLEVILEMSELNNILHQKDIF